MNIKLILFLFITGVYAQLYGQDSGFSVIAGAGFDNYNGSIGSFGSGGPMDYYWLEGISGKAGIEKKLSGVVSIQSIFSMSVHNLDTDASWGEKTNLAKNYLMNLTVNLKFNIDFFYYTVGLGIYSLKEDPVFFTETNPYHNSGDILHSKVSRIGAILLIGTGFNLKITDEMKIFAEMDANIRQYLGGSVYIGINHNI